MSLLICVKKPSRITHRLWRWIAVAGLLVVVLPGCALNRMYEVKQQFCDFDGNFSYSLGTQPEFVFHRPLILAKDVKTILGYDPTTVFADGNSVVHRYVIEKVTLDAIPGETYTFDLKYQADGKKKRLQSIQLPPELAAVDYEAFSDPIAVSQAANEVCGASIASLFQSMEEDIDPRHLQNLPDRHELVSTLGAPTRESEEERALIYEYRISGDSAQENVLNMVVWFDEEGIKPVRMESRHRQMLSEANFEQGKIRFAYGG
jgi:hypothetical protein